MVVATYTINEERAQRITFAGPYYEAGQMLMARADNDANEGPEDLADNPDSKVCSVTGSTPATNIEEYLAAPTSWFCSTSMTSAPTRSATEQVDVVTTDNVILAVSWRVGRRVQARRRAVHRGALRHRDREGERRVL